MKFYFGNTRIRVFAMNEELMLNYKFHRTGKYLVLKKPPKPEIDSIYVNDTDLWMEINVIAPGYDDIDCRAWFQVELIGVESSINDEKFDTSPILLDNLSVGLEYKIRIKCVNDKGMTYSDEYDEIIVLKRKPPFPRIQVKYAIDSKVYLKYECKDYRYNEDDDESQPKFEIKILPKVQQNIITTETNMEIDNLRNGESYIFKIRASNKYGLSDWSESVALRPLKKPCKPSDLKMVIGCNAITIYWISFDNMMEEYLSGEFRIISDPQTESKIVKTKHKVEFKKGNDDDQGLQDGVEYRFKVIALNDNFKIESDWTQRVKLDENKTKKMYRQEKEEMADIVYREHAKELKERTKDDKSQVNEVMNKRRENMRRQSTKYFAMPLSNFAHINLHGNETEDGHKDKSQTNDSQ